MPPSIEHMPVMSENSMMTCPIDTKCELAVTMLATSGSSTYVHRSG